MVGKKLLIKWDRLAVRNLNAIYDYIALESDSSARMVKKELITIVSSLSTFPRRYPIERYLIDEELEYRSVTKWSYKIIYEVTSDSIIIVDIFHTSQHPDKMIGKKK